MPCAHPISVFMRSGTGATPAALLEVRGHAAGRSRSKSFGARGLADSYSAEVVRFARRAWHSTPAPGSLSPELVPACGRLHSDEMATCSAAGPSPPAGTIRATNRPLAVLLLGESWNNMHHFDPACARYGVDPGQFDLSAALSCVFERAGWATRVRWPSAGRLENRPPPWRGRQRCASKPRPRSATGSAPHCPSPLTGPRSPGPGAFWPADGAAWTPRSKPRDHAAAFAFVRLRTVLPVTPGRAGWPNRTGRRPGRGR
jgi:hypothetical protein